MGLKSSATSLTRQIIRSGSFRASVAGLWRILVSLISFTKIHSIPENPSLISRTISCPSISFLLKLLVGSLRFIIAPSPIRATKTSSVSCSGTPVPFNIEKVSTFPSVRTASISSFPTRLRGLIRNCFLNHKSNHQTKYFISKLGFVIQVEDKRIFLF